MTTFNIVLVLIACGLSGYAISAIGGRLNIPFWLILVISATFGWLLAGVLK